MFPHWVAGRLSRHIHLCMFWTLQLSNDTTPIFPGSHSRKESHMANLSQHWFALQCPAVLVSHALRLSQLFLRDLVAFKVRWNFENWRWKKVPMGFLEWSISRVFDSKVFQLWTIVLVYTVWTNQFESIQSSPTPTLLQHPPEPPHKYYITMTNTTQDKQKLTNINQQLTSINHQHQTTTSTLVHFPTKLFHFKSSPSDRSTCHKGWHHAHHISPPRPQLPLRHPMQRTPTPQRGHPTDGRRNETSYFHGGEKRFKWKVIFGRH